jgi:hypothetical protein
LRRDVPWSTRGGLDEDDTSLFVVCM